MNGKSNMIETKIDINTPVEREKHNHIFTYVAKVDKKDGTIYISNTGNLPIRSIDGKFSILFLYYCTTNAILATPIKYTKDKTMIDVFKTIIK